MNSFTAANVINIFNGTCNFATLVGAFLSDTYFGRYKTIRVATLSTFLGMLALTLTAAISKLHPPQCKSNDGSECDGPTIGQLTFLITSFGFLVLGAGGIRPCNMTFGADQFNPNTDSGRKGLNSFFNWYYSTIIFIIILSLAAIIYVQVNVSWALGLAIPTILMFCSCVLFLSGSKMYVKIIPDHSPIKTIAQVIVVAIKKRRLMLTDEPQISLHNHIPSNSIYSRLPYTDQLRFFNKATIISPDDEINIDGSASNPWRLCSIQQVEEVKCVIKVIPIWIACVIYYIIFIQMLTNAVFQALQTDRSLTSHSKFKIPAATYNGFSMLALTIWVPIYDRIILPKARKITKTEDGISKLQRLGFGFFLAIITMTISGLVESKRRYIALTEPTLGIEPRKGEISAMSSYWLLPQLAISGIAEGFSIIGQIEFYYKEFPENMRSFGGAFLFCGFALGAYLSSFIGSIVYMITKNSKSGNWLAEDLNKGRLDYFYYLIAILEFLNFGYFLVIAKWYKYKVVDSKIMKEKKDQVNLMSDHSV
ncbi:hypothetical protein Leryth_014249 [Lithospermum erythrorhizon]|nr:hypothetical protein Leryth_014249 [Lithospermum erythrorhizon]